jgi:hypothetical protein
VRAWLTVRFCGLLWFRRWLIIKDDFGPQILV